MTSDGQKVGSVYGHGSTDVKTKMVEFQSVNNYVSVIDRQTYFYINEKVLIGLFCEQSILSGIESMCNTDKTIHSVPT